jgi:hypothetical protein
MPWKGLTPRTSSPTSRLSVVQQGYEPALEIAWHALLISRENSGFIEQTG